MKKKNVPPRGSPSWRSGASEGRDVRALWHLRPFSWANERGEDIRPNSTQEGLVGAAGKPLRGPGKSLFCSGLGGCGARLIMSRAPRQATGSRFAVGREAGKKRGQRRREKGLESCSEAMHVLSQRIDECPVCVCVLMLLTGSAGGNEEVQVPGQGGLGERESKERMERHCCV